jgi:hypothetical protein
MSKNTGARGLRTILENILMDSMYEVCRMMILYSLSIHLTCKVYGVGILIVVTIDLLPYRFQMQNLGRSELMQWL